MPPSGQTNTQENPLSLPLFFYPLSTRVHGRSILGSSLSSGATRRRLQICQEALVDGIGDTPLEAAQRLLTRLALRELLAVVGPAPNIRPGLAYRHHVQGRIEVSVASQREPVPYHLPTRGLHRCRARIGGKVSLGWETHHTADRSHDLGGQDGTYTKDLGECGARSFTSASMPSFMFAIFRSSVRMSRRISEASRRRTRDEEPCGRIPRRMCAARRAESVPGTPPGTRSRRSPCRRLHARVRSATKSPRLSERRRSTSDAASGSTAASRSLREAASAVARASSPSFLRALPAKLESTRTRAESLGLGWHVHH